MSVAPDISLLRNFSPRQQFWALGETVQFDFHFSRKQSAYAWIGYYTPGKFSNWFTATGKSASVTPYLLPFKAAARWRNNELSLGWKHYLRGSFDAEDGYNLYITAGFGLLFTKVQNSFSPVVDTSRYNTPTRPGASEFFRLTLDAGAGVEVPLGGNFFLFGDLRTWIPTSDYPSPFLQDTRRVPMPLIASGGMRILFGY